MRARILFVGVLSLMASVARIEAQSVILGEYRPGRAAAASSLSMTLSTEDKAVLDAIAASLSVMDDWDESDRLKVNLIVGQAGVSAGNGTADATTLRVTVASNSTGTLAVTQSGTWTVQPGNTANTTAWLIAGGKTNNNAAPGATNLGALTVLANASAPTWIEGNLVALSADLAGALRVSGAVSCSNCSGTGASKVDDAAFTIATDSVAPAGFLADQVAPDSVNEGDVGLARMTLARIQLHTLWDAAGNERGANVNASNELLVALSSVPSHAVTNAGTFAVQADTELAAAFALADATANPTVPGVAGFNMCWNGSTWDRCRSSTLTETTHDGAMTAASTVGNSPMLIAKDFDGAALPNVVSAEGDGVLPGASLYGVQYVMLVSEDGSLERGTSTTPMVVGDGAGALNVICDSGCSGGTQYTHDAALTIGSSLVTLSGARASAAVPTDVSADTDAVALWALRSGALANQPTFGGVLAVANSGNVGTGVQRVVLATDQPAMAGLGIYTEDAGETAGGNLSMSGSVRRDTLASSAGTTGDNATINTNAIGALWVSEYDPCSSEAKTTDPISLTARGVIVAAVASKKNYICSITLVAAAAEVFNIVEGTGTTCQTGTAAIAGSTTAANGMSMAANSGFSAAAGNGSALAGKTANVDTCFVPSGSNRVSGFVTYVQR